MSSPDELKTRSPVNGDAASLFDRLALDEKPDSAVKSEGLSGKPSQQPTKKNPSPSRSAPQRENKNISTPSTNRLQKPKEDTSRSPKIGPGTSPQKPKPRGDLDIFADPPKPSRKSGDTRPRRNSESSIKERSLKPLDAEEEKKRQERKRREKKYRERDEKDSKSRRPNRKLDVIDKLDVTSIYGTGLFHHDGPFDACNPHRNRQGSKRAPMQAFPKDSLNNVLGGGGPINRRPDHAVFLGNKDEEAFNDYSKGGSNFGNESEVYNDDPIISRHKRQESNVLSATTRVEPIHGEETPGLGTSTFLEGAPASRTAMQRRSSESSPIETSLPRSKSLAQRFRGINVPRRDINSRVIGGSDGGIPLETRVVSTQKNERGHNSTLSEELVKDETTASASKKDNGVTIVEPEKPAIRTRTGSVTRVGVSSETSPNEANGENFPGKMGIGFMSRVKSLKGGSRKIKTSPVET